jgi:YcxB-like protein
VLSVLVAVLGVIGLLGDRDRADKVVSWVLVSLSAAWLFFAYVYPRLATSSQVRRTASLHGSRTLTISASGLRIKSQQVDSHLAWSAFVRWAEGKSVFLVLTQPHGYMPIPKRAFTADQMNEFREILRRNFVPGAKNSKSTVDQF